jgi:hypothetical protein
MAPGGSTREAHGSQIPMMGLDLQPRIQLTMKPREQLPDASLMPHRTPTRQIPSVQKLRRRSLAPAARRTAAEPSSLNSQVGWLYSDVAAERLQQSFADVVMAGTATALAFECARNAQWSAANV